MEKKRKKKKASKQQASQTARQTKEAEGRNGTRSSICVFAQKEAHFATGGGGGRSSSNAFVHGLTCALGVVRHESTAREEKGTGAAGNKA